LCIDISGKLRTPVEVSADILRYLKTNAEKKLNTTITDAVITVPAYFNDAQRQATKDAGKIAGLNVLRIINEPTAAALAYGVNTGANKNILVYDFGGGTFDVTVLNIDDGVFEVKSTGGDAFLGGADLDEAIVSYLCDLFKKNHGVDLKKDPVALSRLIQHAEETKKDLSATERVEIAIPFISKEEGLETVISRPMFESWISPLIKKTEDHIMDVINKSGFTINEIDTVVVVGGSTRVPAVQRMLERVFGKEKLDLSINPDEVVAQGAAIQGSILSGDSKDLLLLDVTPLSLGIETKGGVFTKIVTANTTIPSKKSQVFTTADDNQTSVTIGIYQGERPLVRDNRLLGQFELGGIAPAKAGVPQIEVVFDVDANGILNVSATDKATGKNCSIKIESKGSLSEDDIKKMKEDAEKNADEDKSRMKLISAKNEADGLIHNTRRSLDEYKDKVSPQYKEELEEKIRNVEKALTTDNVEEIEAANKALSEVVNKMYENISNAGSDNGSSDNEKRESTQEGN
jgi:molecular chaperone DnaK